MNSVDLIETLMLPAYPSLCKQKALILCEIIKLPRREENCQLLATSHIAMKWVSDPLPQLLIKPTNRLRHEVAATFGSFVTFPTPLLPLIALSSHSSFPFFLS
jgi:hypothetical protein